MFGDTQGRDHDIEDRRAFKIVALGDDGLAQVTGPAHSALIRRFDTGEHLQQRGLAAAVEAHHPDAVSRLHPQADVREQRLDAV